MQSYFKKFIPSIMWLPFFSVTTLCFLFLTVFVLSPVVGCEFLEEDAKQSISSDYARDAKKVLPKNLVKFLVKLKFIKRKSNF